MSLGSGDVDREWMDQSLGESVVVTLGRADAVKLLEAKKVEMEVGPRQYNIKSGHLSGLKSLLREINRLDPAAAELNRSN